MNCFAWDDTLCERQENSDNTATLNQDTAAMLTTIQIPPTPSMSHTTPVYVPFSSHHGNENTCNSQTTPINSYNKYYEQNLTPRNFNFLNKFSKESRQWEKVRRSGKSLSNKTNSISFVVMSYNILAQTLLENHSHLYKNIPTVDLEWDNRWRRLQFEINNQNPDIICLQEVETSYLNTIGKYLNDSGYKGVFKQKTGVKVDGCAIFFKQNLFDIADYVSVEYMQPGVNLLNRDNVGMMIKLTSITNPQIQLVVCTTHLLYNPKRTDVRLAQMQLFLAEIDRFSYQENSGKDATYLPIIMTGDLNSFPNTPVTKLIDHGNVSVEQNFPNLYDVAVTNACQHLEIYLERLQNTTLPNEACSMLYHSEIQKSFKKPLIEKKYSFEEYRHLFQNTFIRHNINFTSVYDHIKTNGETEASTFQDAWVTVDYIYYSSSTFGQLDVEERYRLPSSEECRAAGLIPNRVYGSDHFALAAKFVLTSLSPATSDKSESSK